MFRGGGGGGVALAAWRKRISRRGGEGYVVLPLTAVPFFPSAFPVTDRRPRDRPRGGREGHLKGRRRSCTHLHPRSPPALRPGGAEPRTTHTLWGLRRGWRARPLVEGARAGQGAAAGGGKQPVPFGFLPSHRQSHRPLRQWTQPRREGCRSMPDRGGRAGRAKHITHHIRVPSPPRPGGAGRDPRRPQLAATNRTGEALRF